MAVDYCTHCDQFKDLDYEDGYNLLYGEYICCACLEAHDIAEEELNGEDYVKPRVPFDRDQRLQAEDDGQPSETQEWHDYDPEC